MNCKFAKRKRKIFLNFFCEIFFAKFLNSENSNLF